MKNNFAARTFFDSITTFLDRRDALDGMYALCSARHYILSHNRDIAAHVIMTAAFERLVDGLALDGSQLVVTSQDLAEIHARSEAKWWPVDGVCVAGSPAHRGRCDNTACACQD